jgi:hypothetical protein
VVRGRGCARRGGTCGGTCGVRLGSWCSGGRGCRLGGSQGGVRSGVRFVHGLYYTLPHGGFTSEERSGNNDVNVYSYSHTVSDAPKHATERLLPARTHHRVAEVLAEPRRSNFGGRRLAGRYGLADVHRDRRSLNGLGKSALPSAGKRCSAARPPAVRSGHCPGDQQSGRHPCDQQKHKADQRGNTLQRSGSKPLFARAEQHEGRTHDRG